MFDSNDPRLTAYILGELDDASCGELEAAMQDSPELRRTVDELRKAADFLHETLHREPAPALTPEQRDAIRAASQQAEGARTAGTQAFAAESAQGNGSPHGNTSAQPLNPMKAPGIRENHRYRLAALTAMAAALVLGVISYGSWRSLGRGNVTPQAGVVATTADQAKEEDVAQQRSPAAPASATPSFSVDAGASPAGDGTSYFAPSDSYGTTSNDFSDAAALSDFARSDGAMNAGGAAIPAEPAPIVNNPVPASAETAPSPAEQPPLVGQPLGESRGGLGGAFESGYGQSNFGVEGSQGMAGESSMPGAGYGGLSRAGGYPGSAPAARPEGLSSSAGRASPSQKLESNADAIPTDELALEPAADQKPDAPQTTGATAAPARVDTSQRQGSPSQVDPFGGAASSPGPPPAQEPLERARIAALPADAAKPFNADRDSLAESDSLESERASSTTNLNRAARRENAARAFKDENAERESDEKEANREKKSPVPAVRTWRRIKAVPNASRLMIGDQDELALQGMQANVTIDGFRARVLLDLYFYNDRGRALEGEFKLRLPNDASLYYFAFGESSFEYRPMVDQLASKGGFLSPELIRSSGTGPTDIVRARGDTWTNVKEAKIVPREKAAHAYSETVRRRVDPALVEWAGAGVFNARVFPLQPGKLHRIVVGYDMNLTTDGDHLTYSFEAPDDLSNVRVDLNLAAMPGAEATVSPHVRPFLANGRAYYHLEGPWDQPLLVRIASHGAIVLSGRDEAKNSYFATRFTPDLKRDKAAESRTKAIFLVDTSLSANPDKFNAWLKLLEATLSKNQDTMQKFAVLFFNIESHWWKEEFVENNDENVRELLNYCNTLALEGATDLQQALAAAASPSWLDQNASAPPADLFLLSDGAVTWGEPNLHALARTLQNGDRGALYAYQTGLTGTAIGVLEHLARESGGAVFSVAQEDEIERAAVAHRQRPWRIANIETPDAEDLLLAGRPKTIYPGQSLTLVGRETPSREVILHLTRGEEQRIVRITLDQAIESDLTARAYGQIAVGQLEDLGTALEDVSVAYARHFRVTGQTCSLLMLETEADYEHFHIRPEDDAIVVRSSAASRVIANKLDELGDQLSDPKQVLQLWLGKMASAPGVRFQLSTAMKLALDKLPTEALEVKPAPLLVKNRSRNDLPKEFFRYLEAPQLDYDAVSSEALRRVEAHSSADALKALSNLVESNPGDPTLARDVAFSAIEWNLAGHAYGLLRRVAEARPYEPQVYQALAHCAAELGNADLAMVYYEVALGGQWHERYQDFDRVASVEYLHLLRRIDRGELESHASDYAKARLESLVEKLPVNQADLVVTLMWNTDRTDVDLHVLEPSGEECFFQHRQTRSGGEITRDVTEGYGPEMYVIRNAPHGKYVVKANYYGSDANRTQVRTKVYVTLFEDFGGRKERAIRKTVLLSRGQELREVAEVFVEKE